MNVNAAAPAVGRAEALVHAPVDTVWQILTDLAGWPRWNSSVSRIQVDGPVRAGTSFTWVAGGTRIVSRLEEVDAPHTIGWSGKTLGIRALHVWRLERRDGGTLVRTEESFEGVLARMFPGLMQKTLAKALEQGVRALKAAAEARHDG